MITDQEIVSVSAAGSDDDARAVSVVTNHWYTSDATYLNTTTLLQEWKKARITFVLVKEEVVVDKGLAPGETQRGRWMGRPVAIVFGADGAMYLSDDAGGMIYRVTWAK